MNHIKITALFMAMILLMTACTVSKQQQDEGQPSAPEETSAADSTCPTGTEGTDPVPEDTAQEQDPVGTESTEPDGTQPSQNSTSENGSAEQTRPTGSSSEQTKPSSPATNSGTGSGSNSSTNTGNTSTNTGSTGSSGGNSKPTDFPAATDNKVLMFVRGTQTVFVGDSCSINYIYFGKKKLTWFTSHPNLIKVDQKGKVTPIYEGNYQLYVTDGQYTAKTEIFAPKGWGADGGMRFDELKMELTAGKSALLNLSHVSPGSAVSYSSSHPSVAKVSGSYVTAVSPGTAVITAKTPYDFARIMVTVTEATTAVSLDIRQSSVELFRLKETKLDWSYNGTGKLEWDSSNWNVARVDENGVVFAAGEGTCKIYLSDGKYADECTVTVKVNPTVTATKLEFRSINGPMYDGVTKYKGDYIEFRIRVTPQDADEDTYITVSDSKVIAASKKYETGDAVFRLDFKKAGTCTVNIHSGDNAVTNSYTVHVKDRYDCYPGSGTLTPEEFVDCYNGVLRSNGMSTEDTPTGYLVLTLSPGELTWEQARKSAEGLGHHWWSIGYRHMLLTYEGTNADGNHVFYERGY